ncbi:hypothetical protein QYB42_003013 [Clostridium perfringens]|nr:hypothetical protein [Clostridium perfringens]ELC8402844.1 hypothetical protein [Clostridium perfringens]
MEKELSDPIEEVSCINCTHLENLECGLNREEDFQDGKNCPKFIPWWEE